MKVLINLNLKAMEEYYKDLALALKDTNVMTAKFQADLDKDFSRLEFGLKSFPTIIFVPKDKIGYITYPSERRDTDTLKMWIKNLAGEF